MVYAPPVDQLLTLGEPSSKKNTRSYAALGITGADIPELIRMAGDDALHTAPGESPAVWAPVHAWRALGELRAVEAIEPLVELLARSGDLEDDWLLSDLPHALAAIGPACIPALAGLLTESARVEEARMTAATTLGFVGKRHPELRTECIGHLCRQLADFVAQSPGLNGFLVDALLELRAVEAAAVMEQAFESDKVDLDIAGDWDDVRIELGLASSREHPRRPDSFSGTGRQLRETSGMPELDEVRFELGQPLEPARTDPVARAAPKAGRNDPCPCGSGKKFKKCCGR